MTQVSFLDDITEAQKLLSQERVQEAADLCNQLIEGNPNNANAFNILGVSYIMMGQPADAVSALESAIALNPNIASYYINLGQAYLFAHQPDDAIIALKQSLKLNSKSADAYSYLAQAYLQKQQLLWSERCAKKALSLAPDHAIAFAHLGSIYTEQKKYKKAIQVLEQALTHNPAIVEAHRTLGILLEENQQYLKALPHLEYTINRFAYDAHGLFALANCYSELGMVAEAIEYYRRALVLQPHNPTIHFYLAESLHEDYYAHEALQHYNHVIELEPMRAEAYANKALLFIEMENYKDAQDTLEEAARIGISDDKLYYPQALLSKHVGDMEQAYYLLQKTLHTSNCKHTIAEIQHHLGDILEAQGAYDNAYDMYEASKQTIITPDNESIAYPALSTIDSLIQWTELNHFKQWKKISPCDNIRAPIFLVGFPQSGGVFIENILSTHPQVLTTHETPIIDSLFNQMGDLLNHKVIYPETITALNDKDIATLRSCYIAQAKSIFDTNIVRNQIIDKMPLNIIHLGLIYRLFPDAKIITVIRDPRDVCLSCFTHLSHQENKTAYFSTLERTIEFYRQVMTLYLNYKQNLPLDITEIRYEDVVKSPVDYAKDLIEKTGFTWDNSLTYSLPHNPSHLAVGRWLHYGRALLPYLDQLDPFVERFGYSTE